MKSTTKSQVKPLDVTRATVTEIKRAIKEKIPLIGISWFPTHYRPDIDEISGITLILMSKISRKFFPEIAEGKELRLRTITKGEVAKLGEDAWYKLLQKGGLAVGIGGGPLDDHGQGAKTSATQKVAEFLGVEKKPWLKKLLEYVNHEDNSGQKIIPDGFSGPTGPMIKATWRVLEEDDRMDEMEARVVDFVTMVKIHLTDQMRFDRARKELARKIRLVSLTGLSERTAGKVPKIAIAESDSERVVAVTRYLHNKDHDLVLIVQIHSSGNFQIHHGKEDSVSTEQMDEVVSSIRRAFINFLNKSRKPHQRIRRSDEELVMDGEQKDTYEIFYYRDGKMIFNGALTQKEVPGLIGEDDRFPFSKKSLVDTIVSALESAKRGLPIAHAEPEEAVKDTDVRQIRTTTVTACAPPGSVVTIKITKTYTS